MGSAKANTLKPAGYDKQLSEIHLKTVTMGGKKDMSKKNNAAKSEKMVVDKTFGMKNKNKSKKVQKFIAQVNHAASNRLVDKKQEKKKDEAKSRKQAKKDHEAEIALLFDVVPEKKKKKSAMDDAPAEAEEEEEDLDNVEAFLAKMGIEAPKAIGRRQIARQRRDAGANAAEDARLQRLADRDGKSVEEKLEMVRAKLALDVPVNKATFDEWKKARDIRRKKDDEQAVVKAKKHTKRGGKSMLSGRQLFEFHEDLFVDDAAAGGKDQYALEFEDAEAASVALEGGGPTTVGDGAAGEGAAGEAPAASNSSAEAPADVAIDESVFLAEDLDGLDDLPSDSDDDE